MKRRKSSPPEETATEESTRDRVSMAASRLLLRPWMVSPARRQRCAVRPGLGLPRARLAVRGDPRQRGDLVPPGAEGGPGPTSVLLEEAQQHTDGDHGRGHVGVVPQLRPEGLDQVCKATGRGQARPGATPRHPPPAPIYRPCSWQRPLRSALLPARPPHRPPRLGVAPCRPSDGTRSDDVAPCRGVISRRREQLALPTGAMSAGEAAGSRAARRWREVGAAAGAQRASALGPAGLRPLRRPGSFRRRQERGRERGSGARPRRPRAA